MADELVKVAEDSARGGFFILSGTAISTVILAIGSILIGRFLGPDLYGQYTLALVVPQFFYLLTDLGINQGITKFSASLRTNGQTGQMKRIIKHGLLLKAAAGVVVFAILYVLADLFAASIFLRPELAVYIRMGAISILFQSIFAAATSAFVGLDKTEYNALSTNVLAVAKVGLSIGLIFLGFSLFGVVIGFVASYAIGAGASLLILAFALRGGHEEGETHGFKENSLILMRYGLPLFLSLLFLGAVPIWQQWVLAWFATNADIGNYKAAQNFVALMTVLSVPITTVLLPAFSKIDRGAKEKIRTLFRLANKYTTILIIPATALVIIFSSEAVHVIYGSTYESAPFFLATYCIIYFLTGFGYLTLGCLYNGLGETKTTLWMSSIIFATLVPSSLILASRYGVHGSIVASIIAHAAGVLYGLCMAARKYQIGYGVKSTLRIYLTAAASAVPTLLFLRFTSLPQLVDIAVGGVLYLWIYLTLMPLTRITNDSEIDLASRVTQKTPFLRTIAKPVLKYQQDVLHLTREALLAIGKIALVVVATIAVFLQDLVMIFTDALENEATSYIIAIPFIVGYLVYRKRKMIKAALTSESRKISKNFPPNVILGILLLLIAFLLYWYGSYTFTPLEYHMLALPVFLSGCVLFIFNTETLKQAFFPVVFLFLMVPPPADILYNLGALLSTISSDIAYWFVSLIRIPAELTAENGVEVINVTTRGGSTIPFTVDVACSGIYSQIGFVVFALFLAYLIRDKAWKKGVVFALGLPLIYFLNVFRIIIIIIIAYFDLGSLALDLFHMAGGWTLIFFGTLLLLVISEKILRLRIITNQSAQCSNCASSSTEEVDFCFSCGAVKRLRLPRITRIDLAKATALILSLVLVLSIQTPVFALTQGPIGINIQTLRGEQPTTTFLPEIKGYSPVFMGHDEDFEKLSKQDASLMYAYFPKNESGEPVFVGVEIASSRSVLHRWETCLITWPVSHGYQPRASQIELRDIQLFQNPPIIGRYFVFEQRIRYTNETEIKSILYWYETLAFRTNTTSEVKNVKISIIAYPETLDNVTYIESQILPIAEKVAGYWQPIKTWSQIALVISRNGDKLTILATVLLVVVVVYYESVKRERRKQNAIAFKKLSKADQQLVTAVQNNERREFPTIKNLLKSYQALSGKQENAEALLRKLSDMENMGIIKKDYANDQDEPHQVWRTDF